MPSGVFAGLQVGPPPPQVLDSSGRFWRYLRGHRCRRAAWQQLWQSWRGYTTQRGKKTDLFLVTGVHACSCACVHVLAHVLTRNLACKTQICFKWVLRSVSAFKKMFPGIILWGSVLEPTLFLLPACFWSSGGEVSAVAGLRLNAGNVTEYENHMPIWGVDVGQPGIR